MSTSARRRLMRDFKVGPLPVNPPFVFIEVFKSLALVTGLDRFNKNFSFMESRIGSWLIKRDEQRMQTDPPAGVSASPVADNVMTW